MNTIDQSLYDDKVQEKLILMEARSSSIKRDGKVRRRGEHPVDAYPEYVGAEKDEEGALYSVAGHALHRFITRFLEDSIRGATSKTTNVEYTYYKVKIIRLESLTPLRLHNICIPTRFECCIRVILPLAYGTEQF